MRGIFVGAAEAATLLQRNADDEHRGFRRLRTEAVIPAWAKGRHR